MIVMERVMDEIREKGASMVEYALLVSLIAMIAFAAVEIFGTELSTEFSQIAQSVDSAG